MIVDTSAIVSMALFEADHAAFRNALVTAPSASMGAPTWLETVMVVTSKGGLNARRVLDELRARELIQIVDFTERHADAATEAWLRYGKGRHAAASLNFGDCMAYAVAKLANEPLLYKGEDFAQTDIASALAR